MEPKMQVEQVLNFDFFFFKAVTPGFRGWKKHTHTHPKKRNQKLGVHILNPPWFSSIGVPFQSLSKSNAGSIVTQFPVSLWNVAMLGPPGATPGPPSRLPGSLAERNLSGCWAIDIATGQAQITSTLSPKSPGALKLYDRTSLNLWSPATWSLKK